MATKAVPTEMSFKRYELSKNSFDYYSRVIYWSCIFVFNSLFLPIAQAENEAPHLPEITLSNHDANKTLDLKPLYLSTIVKTLSAGDLAAEPSYDQSITIQEALSYVLKHGLPLKISQESLNYQHWLTLSNVANALPSFFMSYNLAQANIFNKGTLSIGRTFITGVSYPVFQGGGVVYPILAQRYREKGWLYSYKATLSDVFLNVYQNYTNLVLNRVLMQIAAKTVEVDKEQLKVTQAQLNSGTGTRFAVLQSLTQIAADKQLLLAQQVAVRRAALALNLSLNFPMSVNLVPVEETISEVPLFADNVKVGSLLQDALKFNPSLRQYEMFWLTAERNVQIAASTLYPQISFFTLYQQNDTQVNPAANSADLGGVATSAITSLINSSFAGRVSNNALGQLPSFSPTGGSTSTQGANTGPSAMPAASGGTPISTVQSGSLVSSGAVAPSIFGGGSGPNSGANTNGSLQAPAGIFPGTFRSFQAGFSMTWSLSNMGVGSLASILTAKVLARQALMQANQEIEVVLQQVRSDYLAMLDARAVIDRAAYAVASSGEAWRLSRVRLKEGVGTNLEEIQAQRDYVSALTNQAQAIGNSNIAQAQLLHDMGMISVATLTDGYKPGIFVDPTKQIN